MVSDITATVLEDIELVDVFAAVERVQREGTPAEIAAQYQLLISELYWKARQLPAAVAMGLAGIAYCLGQSLVTDPTPEAVELLRSAAKSLAYDVGSFTWPGWDEPGIHPTAQDLAIGRDCARLNLRLAIELKKPPSRLSMAHWLIGAHALAAGDFDSAAKCFQTAQDVLPATDPAAQKSKPCNMGFLAIARLGKNPSDDAAKASYDSIISALADRDDEDAKVYLPQLESALRLFVSIPVRR